MSHLPLTREVQRSHGATSETGSEVSSPNQRTALTDQLLRNPFDGLGKSTVTLLVGDEEERFVLDKTLLSAQSEFFAKAFSSDFQEKNGVMKLPEEDADLFQKFVRWLYTGLIDPIFDAADEENGDGCKQKAALLGAISLYMLGEKWLILDLMQSCWDIMREEDRASGLSTGDYYDAWKLAQPSKIRYAVCTSFISQMNLDMKDGCSIYGTKGFLETYEHGFLQDVILAWSKATLYFGMRPCGRSTWTHLFPAKLEDFHMKILDDETFSSRFPPGQGTSLKRKASSETSYGW